MKKLFLSIFCLVCLIIPVFGADDTSNKVLVESLENFSFESKESTVKLKVIQENTFENGIKFEKDSIVTAKVAKIVDPKRGKRNGYLIVDPISYTIPNSGVRKEITDKYWLANVLGYKPFDIKSAAFDAGLFAAGMFVKGIGQIYYFGKGVIDPEDGENRLKSGVKSVYKNSPLAYIEEGQEVNIQTGDILLLKFYHSDVPKWKFWQRNK